MEESKTGEEAGPATHHAPGSLCVRVYNLQGAPWPGHKEEDLGWVIT